MRARASEVREALDILGPQAMVFFECPNGAILRAVSWDGSLWITDYGVLYASLKMSDAPPLDEGAAAAICEGMRPVVKPRWRSASTGSGVGNKSPSAGSVIRESRSPFERDPF